MLCDIELKKVDIDHQFYFVIARLFCPFCRDRVSHKIKKYDSLKSLEYHLAREHQTIRTTQFTITEVRALMRAYALCMQIGMIGCEKNILQHDKSSMFPRIKRFEDESTLS